MLRPDDTLQFFTSPYRRTRETTEGILKTLTESNDECGPSPFPRNTIKVFEEPRLREQDFGNFQPCSTEMERMWQERADYGHFFYRIPNGESAADAYDRVSGFNESLWRNFSEEDFPSVCVLVTHGLMTRVFLMKWYHWSVEYFEDLRNVNHCEFVVMKRSELNGKYVLENKLRTWSELKRQRAMSSTSLSQQMEQSPVAPTRKWGGCVGGCNHDHGNFPRRTRRTSRELLAPTSAQIPQQEKEDHPIASQEVDAGATNGFQKAPSIRTPADDSTESTPRNGSVTSMDPGSSSDEHMSMKFPIRPSLGHIHAGRDGGGSLSGAVTPAEGLSDTDEYFGGNPILNSKSGKRTPKRKPTEEDFANWAQESGMGTGARANTLGDHPPMAEEESEETDGPDQGHSDIEAQEKHDRSLRGSVY